MSRAVNAGGLSDQTAVILDIDRTILRSETFSKFIYQALASIGVSKQHLEQANSRQQASVGEAFDYLAYLREIEPSLPPEKQLADALYRFFVNENAIARSELADSVLVPGAIDLIEYYEGQGCAVMLCTSGGELTQTVKIKVIAWMVGRDLPWVIVNIDQQQKTDNLLKLYDAKTMLFDIAAYAKLAVNSHAVIDNPRFAGISRLEVIDDKAVNLKTSYDSGGIRTWLIKPAELVPSTEEDRISLSQLVSYLKHHTIDK